MFRFTIRDLLWLTVVVALGAAWWMDRARVATDRTRLDAEVNRLRSEIVAERLLHELESQIAKPPRNLRDNSPASPYP